MPNVRHTLRNCDRSQPTTSTKRTWPDDLDVWQDRHRCQRNRTHHQFRSILRVKHSIDQSKFPIIRINTDFATAKRTFTNALHTRRNRHRSQLPATSKSRTVNISYPFGNRQRNQPLTPLKRHHPDFTDFRRNLHRCQRIGTHDQFRQILGVQHTINNSKPLIPIRKVDLFQLRAPSKHTPTNTLHARRNRNRRQFPTAVKRLIPYTCHSLGNFHRCQSTRQKSTPTNFFHSIRQGHRCHLRAKDERISSNARHFYTSQCGRDGKVAFWSGRNGAGLMPLF